MSACQVDDSPKNEGQEPSGTFEGNGTDSGLPLPFRLAGAPTAFHLPKTQFLCVGTTLVPRRRRFWWSFLLWIGFAYVWVNPALPRYPWLHLLCWIVGNWSFCVAASQVPLGGFKKLTTDSQGIELVRGRSTTRIAWKNIRTLEMGRSRWGDTVMKIFYFDTVVIPRAGLSSQEFNELFELIINRAGLVPSKEGKPLYERPTMMLTAPERTAGQK